jgi:transcriptional regulator with XRE-family HTH domain
MQQTTLPGSDPARRTRNGEEQLYGHIFHSHLNRIIWQVVPEIYAIWYTAVRPTEIEKRTGLLRCYVSRVENGHTVPAIETLEKFARALEVPLYQLMYDGDGPPQVPNLFKRKSDEGWGSSGKDGRYLKKLRRLLGKANEDDRKLLMHMTQKMARR